MEWASHMRRIVTTLGDDWMFTHAAGRPVPLRGLFLNQYQAAQLGVVGVSGSDPHMAVIGADIGDVTKDDVLVRESSGATYKVKVVQADEESGVTVLQLKKP